MVVLCFSQVSALAVSGSTDAYPLYETFPDLHLLISSPVRSKEMPVYTTVSSFAGSLLDLIAPATGRDWQINVNNIYGGVAKFGTLFGVSDPFIQLPTVGH